MTTISEDRSRGQTATITQDGRGGVQRLFSARDIDTAVPVAERTVHVASHPDLPQLGELHPANAAFYVDQVVARIRELDPSSADVTVQYKQLDPNEAETGLGRLSYTVDLVDETTVFDRAGVKMQQTYTGTSGGRTKTHQATVPRPTVTFELTKRYAVLPHANIESAGGKINATQWGRYVAERVLCRGAVTQELAHGVHRVTWLFTVAESWQEEFPVDVEGSIPDDVTVGNGIAFFDVLPTFDFNLLGVRVD